MIDMQLLNNALMALAILVGVATALSVAMVAAATITQRGSAPRGGTRREPPPQPTPDNDNARELVLR